MAARDAAKRKRVRIGALGGLAAGPFFLVSVGLNTWASLDYLHDLGWEFVGGAEVPWPSALSRGPYAWAQIATFVVTGLPVVLLAVTLRERLPRRATSTLACALLGLLGAALALAAFRVDAPMLRGREPETWNGWAHAVAFLGIVATAVLAPLAMALAVRRDVRWRPIPIVSLSAAVLFIVFLALPWGNASFLVAVAVLFAWVAAVAARALVPRAQAAAPVSCY